MFKETLDQHCKRLGALPGVFGFLSGCSPRRVKMLRRALILKVEGKTPNEILRIMGSNVSYEVADMTQQELKRELKVKWSGGKFVPK